MPWQLLVAEVGGELVEVDGEMVPAYRDVVVTVPRQSGKTTLVLSWMIQRAHGWGRPQKMAYSAQTGNDARKKLVEDWEPILKPNLSKLAIRRILKGMGNEAVEFRNGSRIVLLASSEEAGHGKTIHLGVKDELFADADFRRDQALVPAMSTITDGQTLTTSTAGTDASLALNAAVARGRQAVADGLTEGIAYLELSASEDDDLEDPESWWRFMPALGHTQTVRSIQAASETLAGQPGEFRRAFGNLATIADEQIIPPHLWLAASGPDVTPARASAIAIDVNPDRSWASLAISDAQGVVELVEREPGTRWVLAKAADIASRWNCPIVLDPSGPAGALADKFGTAKVQELSGREYVQACGALFDDIIDGRARVRSHPALDDAVKGARKRVVGDAWAWARKDASVDVSPLVAVTLARWAALHGPEAPVFAY